MGANSTSQHSRRTAGVSGLGYRVEHGLDRSLQAIYGYLASSFQVLGGRLEEELGGGFDNSGSGG